MKKLTQTGQPRIESDSELALLRMLYWETLLDTCVMSANFQIWNKKLLEIPLKQHSLKLIKIRVTQI